MVYEGRHPHEYAGTCLFYQPEVAGSSHYLSAAGAYAEDVFLEGGVMGEPIGEMRSIWESVQDAVVTSGVSQFDDPATGLAQVA